MTRMRSNESIIVNVVEIIFHEKLIYSFDFLE
jgi:hypothetical protein